MLSRYKLNAFRGINSMLLRTQRNGFGELYYSDVIALP